MGAITELNERVSYRAINHARRNHTTFVALAFASWFRLQSQAFVSRADELTEANSDQVFDESIQSVSNERVKRTLMLTYLAGMLWSKSRYDLKLDYDLNNMHILLYDAQQTPDLLTQLNATTKKDINDLVSAELTTAELQKAIRQLFVSYYTDRSTRIGQHAGSTAFILGTYTANLDSGLAFEKKWLTAGDDKVEQECLDNEAQGWIGLTVVYNRGTQCPPEHNGCRCGLDYRLTPVV